jgi:PKD repeat protein
VGAATVDATPGGVGVPSAGSFGEDHIYADDGTYTVTVTIHDDDGGVHLRQFDVVVDNTNPEFIPAPNGASIVGDDITSTGFTTIQVSFRDAGFDNPANPNAPVLPDISNPLHESFTHVLDWGDGTIDAVHTYVDPGTYSVTVTVVGADLNGTFTFTGFDGSGLSALTLVNGQTLNVPGASAYTYEINWGDGTIQTVTLTLNQPLAPVASNGLTTVFASLRTSGDEGVDTTGSFEVRHQYLGPPNPGNPTADIPIRVTVVDDNNSFVSDVVFVANSGIDTVNVAIDTTPLVPRLDFVPPPPPQALLEQVTTSVLSLQTTDLRVASAESATASSRYLVLVVVSPDGEEIESHLLDDDALLDLPGLFATLPENRYRIYLVRTENNVRRLVIEVSVRRYFDRVTREWRGRIADPNDISEGTRDLPPTSESELPVDKANLDENPMLKPLPKGGDTTGDAQTSHETGPAIEDEAPQPPAPGPRFSRWSAPLAGLALATTGGNWSQRLDAALRQADDRIWQRLRRVGRQRRHSAKGRRETRDARQSTDQLQ